MAVISIDSENFTEEQFSEISNLIKKYDEENKNPLLVAAKTFAKTKTSDEGLIPLVEDSFKVGALWQKELLTEEEYTKIIYVLAASFNNPDYDDNTRKSAMQFVFKLCRIFGINPQTFIN